MGLGSAITAGVVDIGSQWATNLKSGVCKNAFWLNREQCCWASNSTEYDLYNNVKCDDVFEYSI